MSILELTSLKPMLASWKWVVVGTMFTVTSGVGVVVSWLGCACTGVICTPVPAKTVVKVLDKHLAKTLVKAPDQNLVKKGIKLVCAIDCPGLIVGMLVVAKPSGVWLYGVNLGGIRACQFVQALGD
jgi:hypothetical protein